MRCLGGLVLVEDQAVIDSAAGWLRAASNTPSAEVGRFVTEGFGGYARIFHPATREAEPVFPLWADDTSGRRLPIRPGPRHEAVWRDVAWREVADANGRIVHPGMQWRSVSGDRRSHDSGQQPGLWERPPQRDSLPHRLTCVVCEILERFTTTPNRCWCAVWEGYGDLVGVRADLKLPRLVIAGRSMLVGLGSLHEIPAESFSDPGFAPASLDNYRSPSLWWPDDRAWCVATDVDFDSTYIGASAECVATLIADSRLEALEISADQSVRWDTDTINAS